METYAVGTAVAARGERAFGTIPVPGLDVALPVAVLHGRRPGPTVCVTAGIHGAEYVGIEAAIRTIHTLDPQRLATRCWRWACPRAERAARVA